jgi:hypothetical protein
MKLSKYLILGGFLLSFQVSADSVYEWGHWQAEEDPAKAILEGADPSEVTAPTAAGGISRPFSPVVFPRNEPPLDTGLIGPSSSGPAARVPPPPPPPRPTLPTRGQGLQGPGPSL